MKLFNGMTVENNELAISGVMVSELRRKYGTPLYVYDENMLENQCQEFSESLSEVLNNILLV